MRFILPLLLILSGGWLIAEEPLNRLSGPESPSGDPARAARLERARAAMKAAVDADPDNFQLWIHLGFIHHKLGDLEGAQTAFEKVVQLEPAESSAHYMLALIYEKKGLNAKAIASWNAVLANSKDPNVVSIANKHLQNLR